MKLSPRWIEWLAEKNINAIHWSTIGAPNATDETIFEYARIHQCVILTQDLDFSQILFSTAQRGPSVILLRMRDEFDQTSFQRIMKIIISYDSELTRGALLTISDHKARLLLLPL